MKSKIFLLLCILCCLLNGKLLTGQNQKKIDSLQQLIKETNTDSVKIQLYGQLAWVFIGTRIKTKIAGKYADSIKLIAKKSDSEYGMSRYHFYQGVIGRIENNHESGLNHFRDYIAYHKQQGDSTRVARGLFHVAVIYEKMGDFEKSLSTQYRVLAIQESEKDLYSIASTTQTIGGSLFGVKRYEEAIQQYKKALAIFKDFDAKKDIANVNTSLGNAYVKLHQTAKANSHYQNALKIYKDINQNWGIALTLANIGFLYDDIKEYAIALEYHHQALELRKSMPGKSDLARSFIAVGSGYKKLHNYARAKYFLEIAYNKAKAINAKPLIRDVQGHLRTIYVAEKKFKKAYDAQEEFILMKDSILNEATSKRISDLKNSYETVQKDKEIEILTKENELQVATAEKEATLRNALFGGLIALGVIGLLLFNTMRQRLKNQKLLTAKNEEITKAKLSEELQTLEMKALRAQMNPHFLFNSLNSINTMILNDEPDNASKYLSKFSKLVRLMLENSEQTEISLKDELETLEAYIQLEAIRFNNKMDYKIDVDSGIDQEDTYLPSMVLQPFVENAIWHGLLHKNQKGKLTIDIKEDGDNLLCSVIDNGVGREKSLILKKDGGLKKKSMGIQITTDRLKLLTKQKIKDVIKIIDLKDNDNNPLGTKVNIQIPLS